MAVHAQTSGLRLFLGIQLPCLLSVDVHHPVHSGKGHSGTDTSQLLLFREVLHSWSLGSDAIMNEIMEPLEGRI